MESKYLPGILVVEGKDDMSLISSFLKSEIFVTNGFELDKNNLKYLKELSLKETVFILTDPDDAGDQIRENIHKEISNYIDINVKKEFCNKNNKHGVAECKIEEIILQLQPYFIENDNKTNIISNSDLFSLGLIGNSTNGIRRYVCDKYNLGNCNGKNLAKRLNSLSISKEELSKALEEYNNGN